LCTGLSPAPAARSSGVPLSTPIRARGRLPPPSCSSNPRQAAPVSSYARQVWAPPRSLAATRGILSSPRGTQMFHFPRFPPRLPWVMGRAPTGLPHSDPPGSQAASASPGHFAAWPRPSSAAIAKASTLRPSSGRLSTPRFLTLSPDQVPYLQRHQTGSRQYQDEPSTVAHLPEHHLTISFPVQVLSSARQDSCFEFLFCSIVSMQCAWMIRHDRCRPHASSTAARPGGSRVARCQGAKAGQEKRRNMGTACSS
jgi:hypothetical protein